MRTLFKIILAAFLLFSLASMAPGSGGGTIVGSSCLGESGSGGGTGDISGFYLYPCTQPATAPLTEEDQEAVAQRLDEMRLESRVRFSATREVQA